MSQVCVIQTQIRNLDLLKAALTELDWEFCEGPAPVRYYHGLGELCDHTIEINDPQVSKKYSIGLLKQDDGSWAIKMDNSMHGAVVSAKQRKQGVMLGQTPRILGLLKSGYAKQAVLAAARAQRGLVRDRGTIEYQGRKKRLLTIEI